MADEWVDAGPVEQLRQHELQQLTFGRTKVALATANMAALIAITSHSRRL